jgi:uncharacterized membrane protein (DUF4010 family)
MSVASPVVDLAIALGLGLLVGLQRESSHKILAGLRTFALVTVSGAICALLLPSVPWMVPAGFLGLGGLVTAAHFVDARRDGSSGLTTEVALLAMFLVGVYLVIGDRIVAVVVGGGIAVLLQAKAPFRRFMERLGEDDVRAIMKFALLSLVILPVLPNRDFGPWRVFNLFEIWLLVVLIVGIGLAGYVLYKFTSQTTGALVGGILGGIISSTATTVSYSRRTKNAPDAAPLAAVVVMIATAIVMIRVLIEVAAVAPRLLGAVAIPLSIVLAVSIIVSLVMWWRVRGEPAEIPQQENPTMLRAPLIFAAVYAIVLLAVEWVRHNVGTSGVYVVAVLAGLTDVDAITLSTARMAAAGQLSPAQAWRIILVGYVANLVFKAGVVATIGTRRMFVRVALMFGILAGTAAAVMVFFR